MELRGSGPISGPMGGGGAGRLGFDGAGGCEMIGLLKLYEIVFFDVDVVFGFSFMAESVFEAAQTWIRDPARRSKKLICGFFLFMILYFSTISPVFQPRKAKKRQNIQPREAEPPLIQYAAFVRALCKGP